MIKEIKAIHPEYVAIVKNVTFYSVYGKDACIISYLLEYKTKEINTTLTCGFPINSIKRVQSLFEKNNINYLILNKRCRYEIEEKIDYVW